MVKPPFVGRNNRPRVAEAQRKRRSAQLAGDEPCHGHGSLTHECDHVAARVGELEKASPLLGAESKVEHIHALDQRGYDVAVTPAPHLVEKRFLRRPQGLGLERKEIAETRYTTELRRGTGTSAGEETSGPRPAEALPSSSSSSSRSPSASSEKSIASPSSSTVCIPSSMSSVSSA